MKELDVTTNQLKAIETPEATKSFKPIPHYELVKTINERVKESGHSIVSKRIDVTREGLQLFGSMVLESNNNPETQFMLGFRASNDKSIAIGFCSGLNIIVCENMMFNGEYITFRKHTSGLSIPELEGLIDKAIKVLPLQKEEMDTRFEQYREHELAADMFRLITYDFMAKKVFPASQFNNFHKCFDEEYDNDGGQTLATIHNAATRLIRKESLMRIASVTPTLTKVTDDYYELLAA